MARRDDHYRHYQLHYASILPSNTNGDYHHYHYRQHDPRAIRKSSEPERRKAVKEFD